MRRAGFTLIELLIVMAVIALLTSLVAPRFIRSVDRASEAALRENLHQLRDSIDKFYADRGRYPDSLTELATLRYLRAVPVDPMTGRNDTWKLLAPPSGVVGRIQDVRSGASGRASDGTEFGGW